MGIWEVLSGLQSEVETEVLRKDIDCLEITSEVTLIGLFGEASLKEKGSRWHGYTYDIVLDTFTRGNFLSFVLCH